MNVTYRGSVYHVETEQDIQTLMGWLRLLSDLDRWLGLRAPLVGARVA